MRRIISPGKVAEGHSNSRSSIMATSVLALVLRLYWHKLVRVRMVALGPCVEPRG